MGAQGLKRRKEVATARSLLELLQELSHVASKVEKLLAEVAAAHSGSSGGANGNSGANGTGTGSGTGSGSGSGSGSGGAALDLDAHSRLLERVAGEVSRLTFQANRGKVGAGGGTWGRELEGCTG